MDTTGFSLWEIAKGGWVAAAMIVAWVGRSHMKHDSEQFTEVGKKHDTALAAVTDRLTEVADQMSANHTQILTILLRQNQDRVDVASALAAKRP